MSNEREAIPLKSVADILCRHGVEFIVIGGQAESLHGSARITYDVDLCYRKTAPNLERLAAALKEMRVTLRNAPRDLPFQIDARSLALGDNFTFETPFGDVDFLGYVEPIGGTTSSLRTPSRIRSTRTFSRSYPSTTSSASMSTFNSPRTARPCSTCGRSNRCGGRVRATVSPGLGPGVGPTLRRETLSLGERERRGREVRATSECSCDTA